MAKVDIAQFGFLNKINRITYSNKLRITGKPVDGAHDCNWAKEHELFYHVRPKSKPFVKRVFLSEGRTPAGFVHLRPISDHSEVSECYLKPPKGMNSGNRCYVKCMRHYDTYGEAIDCVPFIMPESTCGMCAQGSTWICLKVLENLSKKSVKSRDIPYIQNMGAGRPFADRQGLSFVSIARLFRMCDCNAFYTTNSSDNGGEGLSDDAMLDSIYSYVESGLPVVVGVEVADLKWWENQSGYHSIVVIGHTMDDKSVDGFIVHDESVAPYLLISMGDFKKAFHHPFDKDDSKKHPIREFVAAVPPQVELSHDIATIDMLLYKWILEERFPDEWDLGIWKKAMKPRSVLAFYDRLLDYIFKQSERKIYSAGALDLLLHTMTKFEFDKLHYYWAFFFYENIRDRMKGRESGFYLRDATGDPLLMQLIFSRKEKSIIVYSDPYFHRIFRESKTGKIIDEKKKIDSKAFKEILLNRIA